MPHPTRIVALAAACGLTALSTGCASRTAFEGVAERQHLSRPQPVAVKLPSKANPDTFRAQLNGRDVTSRFSMTDGRAVLEGVAYPAVGARTPQTLTVTAQPKLNKKGKPVGKPVEAELNFFPPALTAQGNVGSGARSRLKLVSDQQANVRVRIPAAVTEDTQILVTAGDARVAVGNATAGRAYHVVVPAGRRVAAFTVHGVEAGSTQLSLSAPGFVSDQIAVEIKQGVARVEIVDDEAEAHGETEGDDTTAHVH